MSQPQIIVPDYQGMHNASPDTAKRIMREKTYQDLSTIIITPCLQYIPAKVVQNWLGILKPMNQKVIHLFAMNMEVGHAYSETIEMILANPELSKWKFLFCLEHDNMVSPDVLLKMYQDMDDYDAVGSLYYTKGFGGQPMCYGNPSVFPVNFVPFQPAANAVTPCRGLGMGATMFKLSMFKDKKLPRPLFQTVQKYVEGQGSQAFTQDLKFFEGAGLAGYKFGCTTKTLTGHYDVEGDTIY